MALSHSQLEKLSLFQDKYINKEITKAQYDSLKAEILAEGKKTTKYIHAEEAPKSKHTDIFGVGANKSSEDNDDDSMIGNIIYAIFALIFGSISTLIKQILLGLRLSFHFLHKKALIFGKKKSISITQLYSVFLLCCLLLSGAIFGGIQSISSYGESKREQYNQKLAEERAIEEKIATEKRLAEEKIIEEEKAKTPHPSITLLSNTGNQGKKTEYVLRFSSTGADTVTVNSETMSMNGSGTYEKSIILPLGETSITILAKNKYFSDELGFMVSREKTDTEIKAEEQEKARIDEEVRKEAEQEILAEKQKEAEKKQQLEDEKKTYTNILYAKLKKNTNSYAGKRIKFSGKIFSAEEKSGMSAFQINTSDGGYSDQIIVSATWQNDYVEGNWVTVWGEVVDEFCYTSQAGWNICVPRVKANIIE